MNTTGEMRITLDLNNDIPSDGVIELKFPPTLQWTRDISTNHLLPIEDVTCSVVDDGSGGSLVSSAGCVGLASQQTVTISFTFSASASRNYLSGNITVSIIGLFSPPTTEPIDLIEISSKTVELFEMDKCQATVSNLSPKVMNVVLSPTLSPLYINTFTGLTITFTLEDTIEKTDSFLL